MENPYLANWIAVGELREAVESRFLTQEEARSVLWGQLPTLQRQAATSPPPITEAGQ